jgi:predicted nucleic acid-binding protein
MRAFDRSQLIIEIRQHFAVPCCRNRDDSPARAPRRPCQSGNEALAERFRTILGSWQVVDLTADIAASAARLRASLRLKLADAVQVASAIAVNADALITYDRDLSRVRSLRVLP